MLTRRGFGRLVAAVPLGAATLPSPRARAAEFVYKYGNQVPASHPMTVFAQRAADRIRQESNGRLDIQLFPNNQLGGDTDMLSQLRSGALEFFTISPVVLSNLVSVASISGIGFAFPDYELLPGAPWMANSAPMCAPRSPSSVSPRCRRSGTAATGRSRP